jgi:hypothetical protein
MEGTDSRGTRRTCSFMTSGNPTQGAREYIKRVMATGSGEYMNRDIGAR